MISAGEGSRWLVDGYTSTLLTRPRSDSWRLIKGARGSGYESRILRGLESEAARRGVQKIVLDARDNVTEFYRRHGYAVIGEAETPFGVIRPVRMVKSLLEIRQTFSLHTYLRSIRKSLISHSWTGNWLGHG